MKPSALSFVFALSTVISALPQDASGNEATAILGGGGGSYSSAWSASEQTAVSGSGSVGLSLGMGAGATPPPGAGLGAGLGGSPTASGDNPVLPGATQLPKKDTVSPKIKDCVNSILAEYGIHQKNGTHSGLGRHRIEIVVSEMHGVENIMIEVLQTVHKPHKNLPFPPLAGEDAGDFTASGDLGMGSFETGGPSGTADLLDANATGLDLGLSMPTGLGDMPTGTGDMGVGALPTGTGDMNMMAATVATGTGADAQATASAGGGNIERSSSSAQGFTGPKVKAKLRKMMARGGKSRF